MGSAGGPGSCGQLVGGLAPCPCGALLSCGVCHRSGFLSCWGGRGAWAPAALRGVSQPEARRPPPLWRGRASCLCGASPGSRGLHWAAAGRSGSQQHRRMTSSHPCPGLTLETTPAFLSFIRGLWKPGENQQLWALGTSQTRCPYRHRRFVAGAEMLPPRPSGP